MAAKRPEPGKIKIPQMFTFPLMDARFACVSTRSLQSRCGRVRRGTGSRRRLKRGREGTRHLHRQRLRRVGPRRPLLPHEGTPALATRFFKIRAPRPRSERVRLRNRGLTTKGKVREGLQLHKLMQAKERKPSTPTPPNGSRKPPPSDSALLPPEPPPLPISDLARPLRPMVAAST